MHIPAVALWILGLALLAIFLISAPWLLIHQRKVKQTSRNIREADPIQRTVQGPTTAKH
jgi:hypothetical protein